MSAKDSPPRGPEKPPPLTEEGLQRCSDAHWAKSDPEVARQHAGEWVVAHNRTIVAHGTDMDAVRREAAERLGCPPEVLIVAAIPHPLSIFVEVTDDFDV